MRRNEDRRKPVQGRHGIYDLSGIHLSRHALERFQERIADSRSEELSEEAVAERLKVCRKFGTSSTGTSAYLVPSEAEPFMALVSQDNLLTFLTLEQFENVMADFGRKRWPRRYGRWLRRIQNRVIGSDEA